MKGNEFIPESIGEDPTIVVQFDADSATAHAGHFDPAELPSVSQSEEPQFEDGSGLESAKPTRKPNRPVVPTEKPHAGFCSYREFRPVADPKRGVFKQKRRPN